MKHIKELNFEELMEKLDDINEKIFMLDMKDRWDHSDFETNNSYHIFKNQIEEEIEKRREKDER